MKKLFLSAIAVFLTTTIVAQADISECNRDIPGWGRSLGEVSFRTAKTWTTGDLEWSDVVMATACQKETFDGGTDHPQNFKADCRRNLEGFGDLFSWCAVARFWRQLCPDGWRVPTTRDFILLDEYFGGDGDRRRDSEALITKYTEWGGVRGGACEPNGALVDQGVGAFYWAISTVRPGKGNRLNFFTDGYVSPQGWDNKNIGHTLRCVR